MGTRHPPHSARSCELVLRAVGGARGRPGGGVSCLGVGRPELGALPHRTARPRGVWPGPANHWLWVRGVWAWGPVTHPTERTLATWLCALWGRHEGARGGGASCLGVGRPRLGALPRPTARPWRERLGPANHWLWSRGVWAWGPVPNPTAHALASWLCALWGRQEGAPGGCLFPGCVVSGVGRSRTPDHPSLGRASGTHWLLVRGMRVWEPVTNPTARNLASWLCAVFGRHEGARGGGGRLAWVWGVRDGALFGAQLPVLEARGRGLLPTGCACGGFGRGDQSPTPQRALL